jgi:PIN domain nuclease of toxin-antitoxin system
MGALRLLLDTHAFYWWHRGDPALSMPARSAIGNGQNEMFVSAITAWEFITKFRSGKQPAFAAIAADVAAAVVAHGFGELPITLRHAQMASNLPLHHRDPMDRFIIGQALVEDMTIVTMDSVFASYGTKTLW